MSTVHELRPRHYAEEILKLKPEDQEAALKERVPAHLHTATRQHIIQATLAHASAVRSIADRIMAMDEKEHRRLALARVHENLRRDVEVECWNRYRKKMGSQ